MNMKRVAFFLFSILPLALVATAQRPDPGAQVIEGIEAKRQAYADIALQIWKFAETGYQEAKSSALLEARLAEAGFTVQKGVADIPTAFVASYGSGTPIVAFIGEYDALPGLSQEAQPEKRPVAAGAPGHGCGHNLLGTAAMAAAIAVKDWMAFAHHDGTVRFYGTPAEEGGEGKVYMLRAGLFKDVDVAVSWHPGDNNQASASSNLANISAKFRFHGIAAHAAAAPDKGRSALDAVEAMDMMVNLMREHVPQETRIHYIITNGAQRQTSCPISPKSTIWRGTPTCRCSMESGSGSPTPPRGRRSGRAPPWIWRSWEAITTFCPMLIWQGCKTKTSSDSAVSNTRTMNASSPRRCDGL